MSPTNREALKASAWAGVLSALIPILVWAFLFGKTLERKADKSDLEAARDRVAKVEVELQNNQRERDQILQAVNRVDDKVQRLLERP